MIPQKWKNLLLSIMSGKYIIGIIALIVCKKNKEYGKSPVKPRHKQNPSATNFWVPTHQLRNAGLQSLCLCFELHSLNWCICADSQEAIVFFFFTLIDFPPCWRVQEQKVSVSTCSLLTLPSHMTAGGRCVAHDPWVYFLSAPSCRMGLCFNTCCCQWAARLAHVRLHYHHLCLN